MPPTTTAAFAHNFLGHAPTWYKQVIVAFLLLNPFCLWLLGPQVTGWLLIAEFIFTLAMALKCYPLLPGGLLAVEALLLGMTTPEALYAEVTTNLPVILLLMFMVAGIYFMKNLLLVTFTQILVGVRSKYLLALLFSMTAALLSAFLDALTVTAVIISVAVGFFPSTTRSPQARATITANTTITPTKRSSSCIERTSKGSVPFCAAF